MTPLESKQVMPKRQDLSNPFEIKVIWTFHTEFSTIFNKTSTIIKHYFQVCS